MTHAGFNPYREWLALERSPEHYYELLGLPLWEADRERIGGSAARALSTLRRVKPGPLQGHWKALLDQLEAARDCLLTPDQKSRYDEQLRRKLMRSEASSQGSAPPAVDHVAPHADPMAPVVFGESPAAPPPIGPVPDRPRPPREVRQTSHPLPTHRRATRHRSQTAPRGSLTLVYGLMGVSFVGLLVAFVAVMQWWILPARLERTRVQAQIPQSASDLPLPVDEETSARLSPPEHETADPRGATQGQAAPPSRLSMTPKPMAVEPTPSATEGSTVSLPAATREEINALIGEGFSATVERRWADATKLFRQASDLAGQSSLRTRVDRFTTLNDYAQQYWQAFLDGLNGLQGSELVVNGTRVYVVEVNRQDVVIRHQGRNQRYAHDALPIQVVIAIADRWFDERAATTQVFRGAFMLVTPTFSRDDVREAWQAAARSGAQLGDLIEILDDLEAMNTADRP